MSWRPVRSLLSGHRELPKVFSRAGLRSMRNLDLEMRRVRSDRDGKLSRCDGPQTS